MKRTITAALMTVSIFTLTACNKQPAANGSGTASAADSINGTWRADPASVRIDARPDQYLLKDGQYNCSTCTPPLTIAADGAFHPVTGNPYADEVSVKAVDDHNVTRTSKKGGRETRAATFRVSSDGNKLVINWKDSSTPNAPPISGEYIEARVAAAPAGAHAVSGSWKADKIANVSEDALNVAYKLSGDTLTMSSAGQTFSAKIGGPEAPVEGDIGITTVSVERVGDSGIRETYHRGGKVVSVITSTIGTDGKLEVEIENKDDGSTLRYNAVKTA